MSYGYDNNQYGGNYGQQQQYGGGQYGGNQYNQGYDQGGFNAPPPGPQYGAGPQYGTGAQYGGYDQNSQNNFGGGYSGGQAADFYGGNSAQPFGDSTRAGEEPPSNENLPYPWVREWDENFKTVYYVNPTTTPPTTSWTHPSMPPGQAHPEQLETHREAEQLYDGAEGPGDGQPGERGFVTKAAVGVVGYKALKYLLKNKNSGGQGGGYPQGGGGYGGHGGGGGGFQWGTALTGAAAGAGGAMLLGKLFNGKKTNQYGHNMGPPPFMGGGRW